MMPFSNTCKAPRGSRHCPSPLLGAYCPSHNTAWCRPHAACKLVMQRNACTRIRSMGIGFGCYDSQNHHRGQRQDSTRRTPGVTDVQMHQESGLRRPGSGGCLSWARTCVVLTYDDRPLSRLCTEGTLLRRPIQESTRMTPSIAHLALISFTT